MIAPDTTLKGNRHNDKTNGAICTNIRLSGGGGVQNRFCWGQGQGHTKVNATGGIFYISELWLNRLTYLHQI